MFYFENVIDEIEKRITEEIDINELAREAGMSAFRRSVMYCAAAHSGIRMGRI